MDYSARAAAAQRGPSALTFLPDAFFRTHSAHVLCRIIRHVNPYYHI